MLAGKHPVGSGYSLHQCVIPHWLIEVNRGAAWRIESRQPHRAEKNESKWIARVFKLFVEFLFIHSFPMRHDIQPQSFHLLCLVLSRRNDGAHVGAGKQLKPLLKFLCSVSL